MLNASERHTKTAVDGIRAVEFFAGVGGFATAATRVWNMLNVLPIEIDQSAKRLYELNHSHTVMTREIESLSAETLAAFAAELWWLSPPCQPYSRRGLQRDIDDPRAASLLHLMHLIEEVRPKCIALENVVGFAQSRAMGMLQQTLHHAGYFVTYRLLCPTELGWPNRRPRFYLLANLEPLRDWDPLPSYECSVADLIQNADVDFEQCVVNADSLSQFESGMDRVDPSRRDSVTACFGSSYGKSLLHAGSYCANDGSWRRFSPAEVARLLGYPQSFRLAEDMNYRQLWRLLGNSLSIPVVEYVLRHC